MADFAAAYNRARFWHGNKGGDINLVAKTGLLVSKSGCLPGAKDPVMGETGGGIICLGTTYGTSEDYAPGNVARVFLGSDRASSLAGSAVEGYRAGTFRLGNDKVWRDNDAPQAVATWADIPAACIWVGTLTALADSKDDAKCSAIFGNIASFDPGLPADVEALKGLLKQAVSTGELCDTVDERAKNPILGSTPGPTSVGLSGNVKSGQGKQKRCVIM